jgi:hypothetical protein
LLLINFFLSQNFNEKEEEMEGLIDAQTLMFLQAGAALAIPACLASIVNIGCGKKRQQPIKPSQKRVAKKPGTSSSAAAGGASAKSKRSTKSASSSKSSKSSKKSSSKKDRLKSKLSSKDKSGKSISGKSKKSSKSKKSKRDTKLQQTGPSPASQLSAKLQPESAKTAIEAEKLSAKNASGHAAAALAHEKSAKSDVTQRSTSMKEPTLPSTSTQLASMKQQQQQSSSQKGAAVSLSLSRTPSEYDFKTAREILDGTKTARNIISDTDTARNIFDDAKTARDILDDVKTARNIIKQNEEKGWIESFFDYLFPIDSSEDPQGLHKKMSATEFHPCGVAAFGRR